ncbi:septal ring lytic transglycosylase RlpA family protein [Methylobacterium durans]|uniref:septal ring lytic transglycosylase RlpA family protein n=1 Tax=Methylobacterium durans TaxID=2202825 RepID=UPI002AFF197E|nr:septal ring lytic transglycosylase RlpA family protein [Methylobacterium durans]MEA1834578.1 septal ring lytic transglycosylase RlpA family protein [Methylobacterium durans]
MVRSTKAGTAGIAAFPLRRILAVSAIALATANCSNNPQKLAANAPGNGIDPKYGVKASPRLYNEGDVIPKGGGRRFSGKPYVVAGRTYVPREDARGYVREGLASWYGSAFHGRQTANGEVFDRHSIAAAHPTLPLPSYARVTNTANGRSMIVRVNDRGPYHADRVMDVSEAVAESLEFHRRGTTRVRVEYIGKASVAGSDDRKLLATLRTDGRPAAIGGRSPVMLADLGSDAAEAAPEPVRARAPLAFRPQEERQQERQVEETPRPALRPAPVLVARAAAPVPPALQPTAPRGAPFRPVLAAAPIQAPPVQHAAAKGRPGSPAAPVRLAGAAPHPAAKGGPVQMAKALPPPATKPGPAGHPASGRLAASPMPAASRLAMAKLAAAPPPHPQAKPSPASAPGKAPAQRRSRLAEVN